MTGPVERSEPAERSPAPSPPDLGLYVAGADFPLSKTELLELAEERGAPEDVRQTLEALEPGDFASHAALDEAVRALSR